MISGQLDDNMLGLFPSFDEWARSGGNELVALESAAVVDCREHIRMSYTTSVFTSLSSGTLCTVYFAEKAVLCERRLQQGMQHQSLAWLKDCELSGFTVS